MNALPHFFFFWLVPSSIRYQSMAANSSQGSSETKTEIFLPGRFLPEMHRLMSKQSGGIVFAQYYLPSPSRHTDVSFPLPLWWMTLQGRKKNVLYQTAPYYFRRGLTRSGFAFFLLFVIEVIMETFLRFLPQWMSDKWIQLCRNTL